MDWWHCYHFSGAEVKPVSPHHPIPYRGGHKVAWRCPFRGSRPSSEAAGDVPHFKPV